MKTSALKTKNVAKVGKLKAKVKDGSKVEVKKKLKKPKELPQAIVAKEVPPKKSAEKLNKKQKKKKAQKSSNDDHNVSLEKLKETDPEFYEFLEKNDQKLLKFNTELDTEESDADENGDVNEEDPKSEEDEDSDNDEDEQVHQPQKQFEVASDESDFEDDDNHARKENSVTLKLLKEWQMELTKEKVNVEVIKNVISALNSALQSLAGEQNSAALTYHVDGAAAFNGVIQLCVLYLESAIRRFLGLHEHTSIKPHKCKKWNKLKSPLRGYILDVTKLLEQVSSSNILTVLLKHLHQIVPLIESFSSLSKPILKRLVSLWSSGEETVRVLSFLCILRITRDQQLSLLSTVLKAMYLSYVRNSKFVSPNTLPAINFMRRSLVEMFALDLNVSYQHVFLYIRQLAIHLRNAITLQKKDAFQTVYNWQFINSLRLWAELLSMTNNKTQLQPLIYPLVSIITGTIKLIPTAQWFPLRFHCIQTLIQLSKETRTFIPVLPFILEVLNSNTFNRKHSNVSMKPLQFTCILRLKNNQLLENGFRDEVVENIINCTLDYMAHESYTISYPDVAVPAILQLKQYIKHNKSHNLNYNRKLKQLCDKLEENSNYVQSERQKFNIELKDSASIAAWEAQLRNKGTPLLAYYQNWVSTHIAAQKRRAVKTESVDEYDLPKVLKRKIEPKPESDGPVDLFPSDDEEELEVEKAAKASKPKKEKKPTKKNTPKVSVQPQDDNDSSDDADQVDIVKDLDLDDW